MNDPNDAFDDGDLLPYRLAPDGLGELAGQWRDKPHRLVYDLLRYVKAARGEAAQVRRQVLALTADLEAARRVLAQWATHGDQTDRAISLTGVHTLFDDEAGRKGLETMDRFDAMVNDTRNPGFDEILNWCNANVKFGRSYRVTVSVSEVPLVSGEADEAAP